MGNRAAAAKKTLVALVLLGGASTCPRSAAAYTISDAYAPGCHEQISSQALRTVRLELPSAKALPLTDDEQALVDDLQFTPDADMKDLGGATFLVSIRDNDLKGRGADDLESLAEIHGNPADQPEHCLRTPAQVEPGGTAAAVADCRTFIRQRIVEALDGLDAAGSPDPSKRTTLSLHLATRGQVYAPLPTYYLRMGQAIHAVEDSFTHTYRTPDGMKITVAMDWVDVVNNTWDESRNGPAHEAEMDRCDDPDPLRKRRREQATDAAAALLRGTLDPTKTHDEKMAAVDAALDMYLTYQPGCTMDNQWCDAPENAYKSSTGCKCTFGKLDGGFGAAVVGMAIALLTIARRARRRRATAPLALTIAAAAFLAAGSARADSKPNELPEPSPAPSSDNPAETHAPPPPKVVPVVEPGPSHPSRTTWGAFAGLSGAIDKPALAGTIGGRVRVSNHWAFGLDAEWNPWLSLTGTAVRRGTVNIYGTAILRFPLAYENFNLRSSVSLGTSYLLTNLYGAPSGSLGIYFGVAPLGIEWKASRLFYLIIDPINIAVPIPQLSGIPFIYPQYRLTVGVEFYGG